VTFQLLMRQAGTTGYEIVMWMQAASAIYIQTFLAKILMQWQRLKLAFHLLLF